jgi:CDP-diglyceride synthetase
LARVHWLLSCSESLHCVPPAVFQPKVYYHRVFLMSGTITLPIQLHSIVFWRLFVWSPRSAGFFASTIKRTYKIKDFIQSFLDGEV